MVDKLLNRDLLIFPLDEPRMTYSVATSAENKATGNNNTIVLEQGLPVTKHSSVASLPTQPVTALNIPPTPAVTQTTTEPKYGGKTTADGGRDSTQAVVYKDPATAHLNHNPSRSPVFEGGVVLPRKETDGKPKSIPMLGEAGTIAERIFEGKTY